MSRRIPGLLAALITAAVLLAPLPALATPAPGAVTPAVGVAEYNAKFCGPNEWVRVKLPATEATVHDSSGVCITSMRHVLDFGINSNDGPHWTYPNINFGYEQGNPSCASAKDTCFKFPVQEKNDGTPVLSEKAWLAKGVYNNALDIWFSPASAVSTLNYQHRKGAVEVMIWVRTVGIHQGCDYQVRIDNINWCVRDGVAGGGSGQPWQRITFDAQNGRLGSVSVSNLWLNPFFRNAISHRMLTPDKWLYAIDDGFELYSGGVGNNIHYLSLSGVA